MHNSLLPSSIPECFDHTIEIEDLAWVRIGDGTLALSASGREYALKHGPEALRRRAERYREVALGRSDAENGVREYIDKGGEGTVYQLSSLAKVAIKEITTPYSTDSPLDQLHHMECLRDQIDRLGLDWIGVPKHFGMFFPDATTPPHLIMEKVEGARLWNILRDEKQGDEFFQPLPPGYAEEMPTISSHFSLVEPTLRHQLDNFDDQMLDWGSHNVIVEKIPTKRPYKFWIIDQASVPPA